MLRTQCWGTLLPSITKPSLHPLVFTLPALWYHVIPKVASKSKSRTSRSSRCPRKAHISAETTEPNATFCRDLVSRAALGARDP